MTILPVACIHGNFHSSLNHQKHLILSDSIALETMTFINIGIILFWNCVELLFLLFSFHKTKKEIQTGTSGEKLKIYSINRVRAHTACLGFLVVVKTASNTFKLFLRANYPNNFEHSLCFYLFVVCDNFSVPFFAIFEKTIDKCQGLQQNSHRCEEGYVINEDDALNEDDTGSSY
ncbi:9769_t:CDS:2 [Ambispora gerdemannii]|uniref:9769_t:CDS:1 n=1 Tax=Ambispora gerdemannii TaxID=144530 RepID=A0A9N9BNV9_9GLOM|nr:9769_t:CDS:2 [Ambispora gerdemannii]